MLIYWKITKIHAYYLKKDLLEKHSLHGFTRQHACMQRAGAHAVAPSGSFRKSGKPNSFRFGPSSIWVSHENKCDLKTGQDRINYKIDTTKKNELFIRKNYIRFLSQYNKCRCDKKNNLEIIIRFAISKALFFSNISKISQCIVMNGGLSFPRIPFFHDLNPTID